MIKIGSRITELRKKKGWSQTELAKQVRASREAIGKYERNEAQPSVETAKKIADAMDVSLDYLVGDTTVLLKDKKMIYRLEVLQKVNPAYKERILYMLDLMLNDAQSNSLQEKLA